MSDIQLTIDGLPITVPAGTSIFDAARILGIEIPTLCHQQNETPVGVCRLCVVDLEPEPRVLQAACVRPAENGMKVFTNSHRVPAARHAVLELLMADHKTPCAIQEHSGACQLENLAKAAGIGHSRYPKRFDPRAQDNSSYAIAVDHEACILCDRCIRGCAEVRHLNILGRRGKGFQAGIAFDLGVMMGNSNCSSCGECMVSCPTGALTNKMVVTQHLTGGSPVKADDLAQLPYFHNVSTKFLELNEHAVVRRHFRRGEVICREGEYGRTAFYIEQGTVNIFISAQMGHVTTRDTSTGFFKKWTSRLAGRKENRREGEGTRRSIPIDATVDLPYDNPVAQLHPGDLFGEMTCMSQYPRSATVVAAEDCTVLEMLRNVLDIMQRNKTVKGQLDETYKHRALADHLMNVPLFAPLTHEFIDTLRDRVQLIRFGKGDVIFKQDDPADAFYLVRIGFVKVSEVHREGELVLAYLGRGSYFGETGLLSGGHRTATCTALDHAEVVKIQAEDFNRMMAEFPEIYSKLKEVSDKHQAENQQRLARAASVPLNQFLTQGLYEAQSLLVLDLEKCTRCDQCTRACADAHGGVTRLIREGLRFENYLVATSCRQCRDPLCMVGCPVGSIGRKSSLEVIIEDWCIGCGKCAENCPYGNISMQTFETMQDDPAQPGRRVAVTKRKATSCDLCTDHAEPSCVYACPHDAAHRVSPNEFFKPLVKASEAAGAPQ